MILFWLRVRRHVVDLSTEVMQRTLLLLAIWEVMRGELWSVSMGGRPEDSAGRAAAKSLKEGVRKSARSARILTMFLATGATSITLPTCPGRPQLDVLMKHGVCGTDFRPNPRLERRFRSRFLSDPLPNLRDRPPYIDKPPKLKYF